MAKSKQYGYQLRGDKLSILELDKAGSASGLNYTYTEDSGLDITTDPSAWKSPIENITDGLQLEYLSNDIGLEGNDITQSTTRLIDSNKSTFGDTSWITNLDDILDFPDIVSPTNIDFISETQSDGNTGTVLKVNTVLTEEVNPQGFITDSYEFQEGILYTLSLDMKFDFYMQNIGAAPTADVKVRLIDSLSPVNINYQGGVNASFEYTGDQVGSTIQFLPLVAGIDTFSYTNLMWKRFEASFYVIEPGTYNLWFETPLMANAPTQDHRILFDNIQLESHIVSNDSDIVNINLPSYAQKALLDYVRAQDLYESGDMEKWQFFMKQFRSKLERWEDSRITGPRVLGPHGPSSIT
jgi:hypothetical protein